MKMKTFKLLALCGLMVGLMACFTACEGEPTIPGRVPDPPGPPPGPDVYNDLGFEPHVDGEPFDTYEGLVMAGYQGWFGAPGDGCTHSNYWNTEWYHYRENDMFAPGVLQNSIDFWPDMTEYQIQYTPGVDGHRGGDGGERSSEKFFYPNGEVATVYSAYDESSVRLHFEWMQEYGIDGVFMQRFVGEVVNNPAGKDHFNKVLSSAMKASNDYQRAICVMYDLGGYEPNGRNNTAALLADTDEIIAKYNPVDRNQQKYYLHHNGKPLIVLWGVGFNDGRPYSLDDIETLMNGLKERGFSIMLGVPTYWRERRNDALADPKLTELIKAADVIMPWFVGRFGNDNYESGGFKRLVESDIAWCKTNNVGYAPLCYPGSSDRNMHPNNGVNSRLGGAFLWNQMHHCIKSGAKMLYIAMFDEIDEGTAIYKTLNQRDVPSNKTEKNYWVTYQNGGYRMTATQQTVSGANSWSRNSLEDFISGITFMGIEDNLQTDHYLWLTARGKAMLRGEIPMKESLPARN